MRKSMYRKIDGDWTRIPSCSSHKFGYFCEYEGLLAWGAVHRTGKDFKVCKVKTSCGPKNIIVCNNCFEKIKKKECFIREVKYEV